MMFFSLSKRLSTNSTVASSSYFMPSLISMSPSPVVPTPTLLDQREAVFCCGSGCLSAL